MEKALLGAVRKDQRRAVVRPADRAALLESGLRPRSTSSERIGVDVTALVCGSTAGHHITTHPKPRSSLVRPPLWSFPAPTEMGRESNEGRLRIDNAHIPGDAARLFDLPFLTALRSSPRNVTCITS